MSQRVFRISLLTGKKFPPHIRRIWFDLGFPPNVITQVAILSPQDPSVAWVEGVHFEIWRDGMCVRVCVCVWLCVWERESGKNDHAISLNRRSSLVDVSTARGFFCLLFQKLPILSLSHTHTHASLSLSPSHTHTLSFLSLSLVFFLSRHRARMSQHLTGKVSPRDFFSFSIV